MPIDYSVPVLTVPIVAAESAATETAPAEPASAPTTPALPPGVSAEGVAKFDEARAAFLEGRYEEALKLADAAVALMPRDAVLNEFRALVLFALQRYAESAAAMHAVLDVGPGWDWKTLSSLYPSVNVYTSQLRALEDTRDRDPKAASVRFLLGYHYLSDGYPDAALAEFQKAVKLQPRDTVAAKLVATLSLREAESTAPPDAATAPNAVPSDKLIGAWNAQGPGSGRYSMTLRKEGTFTWSFRRGTRKEEAKGVYTVEGNVLAMEPDTGGVLLAELAVKEGETLQFKMIGGASSDPVLEFRRAQTR
jgi:tetratricopeptide (TPR) repeat protein